MAAVKTVPPEKILELLAAGVREIAENKVQEAESKGQALSQAQVSRHFIGHLQRNKAKKAVEIFDVIQSVDSPRLAEALDRAAADLGKKQICFIEVKISAEPTKTGIATEEASGFIKGFSQYKNLVLKGLMTIAPYDVELNQVRPMYKSFSRFFAEHRSFLNEAPVLSMGMSDDFEMAIEEGATMVRIGRALFGERQRQ